MESNKAFGSPGKGGHRKKGFVYQYSELISSIKKKTLSEKGRSKSGD